MCTYIRIPFDRKAYDTARRDLPQLLEEFGNDAALTYEQHLTVYFPSQASLEADTACEHHVTTAQLCTSPHVSEWRAEMLRQRAYAAVAKISNLFGLPAPTAWVLVFRSIVAIGIDVAPEFRDPKTY